MAAVPKVPKVKAPKVKAPKAPKVKAPDPKKALKKFFNPKKILKVVIILVIVTIIALVVLMFTLWKPGPKDVVLKAAQAAKNKDLDAFKACFAPETQKRLTTLWGLNPDAFVAIPRPGHWKNMMQGILTENNHIPEIKGQEVDGNKGKVFIKLHGQERMVQTVLIDGEWYIHVSHHIRSVFRLPLEPGEEPPEEVQAEVDASNPPNPLWWEDRKVEDSQKKKGCLGCTVWSPQQRTFPADLILWFLALLWLWSKRIEDHV